MDRIARGQITAKFTGLLEQRAIIMPAADAGFRLPSVLLNVAGKPAFEVRNHGFDQALGDFLHIENSFHPAIVGPQAVVVEVGADVHPAPAERQQGIVEIKKIGVVLIDEIARAVEEVLDVGHVR